MTMTTATPGQRIEAVLVAAGEVGLDLDEIATATGLSRPVLYYTLANMQRAGRLTVHGEPRKHDRRYTLARLAGQGGRPAGCGLDPLADFATHDALFAQRLRQFHPSGFENERVPRAPKLSDGRIA
jgi:DNA-binding IclR family transcriptional regulator